MKRTNYLFCGLFMLLLGVSCGGRNENQQPTENSPKVLIVYYSWGGKTHEIATLLQEKTGADICRIETQKTYLPIPEIYQEAKEEINNKNYPELKTAIPDVQSYDLILVGSPVWWYSVSSPMLSLLSQCDFYNKSVASFCTHGGEMGNYNQTFENAVQNAVLLNGIDIQSKIEKDSVALDEKLSSWLNTLKEELDKNSK